MINLETTYMGLNLKTPIIIGSSGLTNSADKIRELEANGAGAVVLKSIFEEQILMEANSLTAEHWAHAEEGDYILEYTRKHNLEEYLKLIEAGKKAAAIPIIASINCVSASEWTSFARKIQDAGADGLELNMFILPADPHKKGEEVEKIYFDILEKVKAHIDIPVALKMSYYFSGLANMLFNLSVRHAAALVLFNRFSSPDIDLDKLEVVTSHVFSTAEELSLPLRWIGMLSGHLKCDLAASTGIHDGESVIKALLAGAKAAQAASAIYKNGPTYIKTMIAQIESWMKKRQFKTIADFNGILSQHKIKNPALFERSQFMKYYADSKI